MASKAEKAHMAAVASLGCVICRQPAEVHHLSGIEYKGMGQRASNFTCIPLCPRHHRTGGYGVAIHAGIKEWEKNFGTQEDFLEKVRFALQNNL